MAQLVRSLGAVVSVCIVVACGDSSSHGGGQQGGPIVGGSGSGSGGVPGGGGSIGSCVVFPADNPWNLDISSAAVDPNSDAYMAHMKGGTAKLHPDFGSDPSYGIPYVVVPGTQAKVPVTFDQPDESDPGPYPIPPNAPVEAGSDGHVLVIDKDSCLLYEMGNSVMQGGGWHAYSGALFDLKSDKLRPDHWTSADAAGLPIFPGLARTDEVKAGAINHALRFTVSSTQKGFVHPATHAAGDTTAADAPPMGLRVRLKASFDRSKITGASLVILTALKKYGMFVADNGSDWYISGTTDTTWNDDDLNQLKSVAASNFEVVKVGTIIPE